MKPLDFPEQSFSGNQSLAAAALHQIGNAEGGSVSVSANHVNQRCYHVSAFSTSCGIIATHGPAVPSHLDPEPN